MAKGLSSSIDFYERILRTEDPRLVSLVRVSEFFGEVKLKRIADAGRLHYAKYAFLNRCYGQHWSIFMNTIEHLFDGEASVTVDESLADVTKWLVSAKQPTVNVEKFRLVNPAFAYAGYFDSSNGTRGVGNPLSCFTNPSDILNYGNFHKSKYVDISAAVLDGRSAQASLLGAEVGKNSRTKLKIKFKR